MELGKERTSRKGDLPGRSIEILFRSVVLGRKNGWLSFVVSVSFFLLRDDPDEIDRLADLFAWNGKSLLNLLSYLPRQIETNVSLRYLRFFA